MTKRDCPDCRKRLQPFWMPASRIGGEVELDRCRECGGVWFDAGELTEASGKLGLQVMAEGVETASEMKALRALNCDRMQGTHISEPLPLAQLKDFLESLPQVRQMHLVKTDGTASS